MNSHTYVLAASVSFRRPHLDDVIEMLITLSDQHLRMKTLGIVSIIASGIILIIITSIGSGPFLTLVAKAYGQQPSTNGSAIAGSTAPKKPLPVLLIHVDLPQPMQKNYQRKLETLKAKQGRTRLM